jgi:hypothetical protein
MVLGNDIPGNPESIHVAMAKDRDLMSRVGRDSLKEASLGSYMGIRKDFFYKNKLDNINIKYSIF